MELQIEAWCVGHRPHPPASHFLLLNDTSLRSMQIRTMWPLAEALREGNLESIVVNSEELVSTAVELHQM
ncbi:hypothetical protein BG74_08975 [Sodalis-like endosymbiont of Proechinophthirus fluctus]|uniref:hypothetical protein n=1 Tax=Sodalis-like endosymbiont of Proechinophthirus fluctus TaxID=1462730 RepID=UPI0007A7EBE1|nr:hypothetical protein [Sodalis-like endosymbiont of Proechinophthirus fluctus]KYP95419.1 hypothetical protein BG74_08975 [Sodalis-like endosymbiont of Proechinophthirus fluctus]